MSILVVKSVLISITVADLLNLNHINRFVMNIELNIKYYYESFNSVLTLLSCLASIVYMYF